MAAASTHLDSVEITDLPPSFAGCDTAQGFLFSRPEHPDVIDALILGPGGPKADEAAKPRPPKARRNRKARGRRRSGRRRARRGR